MFDVALIWNKSYPLRILQGSPFFAVVGHSYEYFEPKIDENYHPAIVEQHFILRITYASKLPGLKLRTVMMRHPRAKPGQDGSCLAAFFAEGDGSEHELVIDTRAVSSFDLVDFVRPVGKIGSAKELVDRQMLFWRFYEKLAPLDVDLHMAELDPDQYSLELGHGGELQIHGLSVADGVAMFSATKRINCCVVAMLYGKTFQVPRSVQDLRVDCQIMDMKADK